MYREVIVNASLPLVVNALLPLVVNASLPLIVNASRRDALFMTTLTPWANFENQLIEN